MKGCGIEFMHLAKRLGRVSTGRMYGIMCMSQGTWDYISDLLRAMVMVKAIKIVRSVLMGKWLKRL